MLEPGKTHAHWIFTGPSLVQKSEVSSVVGLHKRIKEESFLKVDVDRYDFDCAVASGCLESCCGGEKITCRQRSGAQSMCGDKVEDVACELVAAEVGRNLGLGGNRHQQQQRQDCTEGGAAHRARSKRMAPQRLAKSTPNTVAEL